MIQLRDYQTAAGSAGCPRCHRRLRARGGFQHWRLVRALWIAGFAALLPLCIVLASLCYLLLPLTAAFLLGLGPIAAGVREQDRCPFCGLGLKGARSYLRRLAEADALDVQGELAPVVQLNQHRRVRLRRKV